MVEYFGPKKVMTVPFPENNKLPLESKSELDVEIAFPRNQPVGLPPGRAKALLKQSPGVFRLVDKLRAQTPKAETIRAPKVETAPVVVDLTKEEYEDEYGEGDQDTAQQDQGPEEDN
jgi:hypothetical protein